jgi:glycosyltransferase involved in cell wall biosynthesis
MNRNLFIAPAYYEGTSFERIVHNVQSVVERERLPIDVEVFGAFGNSLPANELDDDHFVKSQFEAISYASNVAADYERMLFLDFFNPGVDMLRYIAERKQPHLKIAALIHGGSFFEGDLFTQPWFKAAESSWSEIYDQVYVPSRFAMSALPDVLSPKAEVAAWGFDSITVAPPPTSANRDGVLFPHRLSSDKGVQELKAIVKALPDVQFEATTPSNAPITADVARLFRGIDNLNVVTLKQTDDFYRAVGSRAVVLSCAKQELFGFGVAEAVLGGCIPVLPNGQCYPEFYPNAHFYDTIQGAISSIETQLISPEASSRDYAVTIRQLSIKPLLLHFMSL